MKEKKKMKLDENNERRTHTENENEDKTFNLKKEINRSKNNQQQSIKKIR